MIYKLTFTLNRLNQPLIDFFLCYQTNKLSLTNNFKTNKNENTNIRRSKRVF